MAKTKKIRILKSKFHDALYAVPEDEIEEFLKRDKQNAQIEKVFFKLLDEFDDKYDKMLVQNGTEFEIVDRDAFQFIYPLGLRPEERENWKLTIDLD